MRLVRTRMRRFFVHRVDLIWRYCSLTRGSFYLSANISRVIFFFVRRSWFLAAVTNTGWQKSKASGNGSGSSSRIWLGGRDSNPDSQIQSLESYHWTTSQQEEFEFTYRGGRCQPTIKTPKAFANVSARLERSDNLGDNGITVVADFRVSVPGFSLRSNPGLDLANAFGVNGRTPSALCGYGNHSRVKIHSKQNS